VTDDDGATATDEALVTIVNIDPVADAGPDQTGDRLTPVSFDGSGSSDSDGSIVSYSWDFGDGSTGSGVTTSHQYTALGVYTVTLTVTDNDGAPDADIALVTIVNIYPTANAGPDQTGDRVNPVSFDGSGSSDSDGSIVSYSWDFGDGSTGSGVTTSHQYTVLGTYTVTLTVTDNDGGTDSDTALVTIVNIDPVADAGSDQIGDRVNPVSFDGSGSSDPDGSISSWDWDFGDGSIGSGETTSHQYTALGTYTVTLTVTDNDGGTNSDTATVEIRNRAPTAYATVAPPTAYTYATVECDGSGSSDDDGTIESYGWDFGDGSTGSGQTTTHAYVEDGVYTITLTVIDNDGASDTYDLTVEILNQPPVADAGPDQTGIEGEVLTFDGTGSSDPDGTIASYEWDMGDGTILSGDIVTHSYSLAGTYTVTLTVTDNDGATDTDEAIVTVESAGPVREVTWHVSDIGAVYLKSMDYADLGRNTDVMGINPWWPVRTFGYGETVVNNAWPYIMGTGAASPITSPQDANDWPWYLWTFYRLDLNGTYLFEVNTGAGIDPYIVPILDAAWYYAPAPPDTRVGWDGGNVSFNLYGQYMTAGELTDTTDTRSGHFLFWYYQEGVAPLYLKKAPAVSDDGWWLEFHGSWTFDREACYKYLGFARGTAYGGNPVDDWSWVSDDLREQYLAYEDGSATGYAEEITFAWNQEYMLEGGVDGIFDVYTGYEYSQDLRFNLFHLDPGSTADEITIRMYTLSWGMEIQMWRYIEAMGLSPTWQGYSEPIEITGEITPTHANITWGGTITYNMLAWKDSTTDGAAWQLAPQHTDYGGNDPVHTTYRTPFNDYDPEQVDPDPALYSWTPGIMNHGTPCFYFFTPMEHDIIGGETIIYELPTEMLFITPYVGTDDGYSPSTGLDPWKITEILSYSSMGTVALGTCWPDMTGWYDSGTNTITIVGPQDFPRKPNDFDPALLMNGVPELVIVAA
jgi:PKD repeat protein